jgi:hypothetical protein
MDVREYLLLKHDGSTVHFPVEDGDEDQARLRAALSRRPDDEVVVVTDDAYFRLSSSTRSTGRRPLFDSELAG